MSDVRAIITVSLNPAIDRVIEVENFTLGEHQVGHEIMRIPGGKAVNVSRVLKTLGVRNIATGFLGRDNRHEFDSVLSGHLVGDEFFLLPGRTRENITIADPKTNQETHIRNPGLTVDPRSLKRLATKLNLVCRQGHFVVFSGSLPPGVEGKDFVTLLDICRSAGAHVAVDTTGEALDAVADQSLWLVKPNAAELARLAGRELHGLDDELRAARALVGRVKIVLFTRGAEGAYLFTEQFALHARAEMDPARVRNTVGCGDVLLGAFLAGLWRGRAMIEAFADAVAAATASACTIAPAEFESQTVAEFRAALRVESLPPA
ncbi:MAG TPA: 1-phosphofructokinase family hexose kinase [Phycisphaerae bacterium]|nr:1-phosphofructokinase family hexose kinase [Phycisphaerae bacterium]